MKTEGRACGRLRFFLREPVNRQNWAQSVILVLTVVMALLAIPAVAVGAEVPSGPLSLSLLERARQGSEVSSQATDPQAAEELPHRDLGREEAIELTESVFGPQLQSTEGIFGELDVKKYLSNQAAVVTSEAEPEAPVQVGGGAEEPASGEGGKETVLLESTVPLRTESQLGALEPVNLALERDGAQLEPAAPLVEVKIPKELGEGVELPESGIGIELVGAPSERAPTVVDENVAAYPNVATDTDFSVAPTPTGVETLTTVRSAESPDSERLRLDLPAGETLSQDEGGAVVERDGGKVLAVLPPTATDANGAPVPVSLSVEGNLLTLTASPGPQSVYPILVDPLFESYDWFDFDATTGQETWHFEGNAPGFSHSYAGTNPYGIWILAPPGSYYPGNQAGWYYYVPRLKEEEAQGRTPTSYIVRMNLMHVGFHTSSGPYSPYETMGILGAGHWAGVPGHEAVWGYGGNYPAFYGIPNYPGYPGWEINFENGEPGKRDQTAKVGLGLGLASVENANLNPQEGRIAELGGAAVEVADEGNPKLANGSISPWMNQTATAPITAEASDTGLGVKYIGFELPGGQGTPTLANPCSGAVLNPCPAHWTAILPTSQFHPASMPQGIDEVRLTAEDVVGNKAPTGEKALLRIDHTVPHLALSGTLTGQATLGTDLPQYTLKYAATDGTEAAPQSGVVSTEVRVDGKAVEAKYAPGCSTRNCSISKEWVLTSSKYEGEHTLEVIATDGVNLATTESLKFKISKDSTAPTLTTSGNFFEGPEGWLTQKSYAAQATAKDPGGYGVSSLAFKVDGKTIKSTSATCPSGGCAASISTTLNMASYVGGAHSAEVVATDGAGNTTTRHWAINVDPSGNVSSSEVANTIEAYEGTEKEAEVVGAPEVEEIAMGEGVSPGLSSNGSGQYDSTGTPVASTVVTGPGEEVKIDSNQGSIAVKPVASSTSSGSPNLIEGVASVSSDTATDTDTISRPKYNGLLQFEDIREPSAPEAFSWEVVLLPGEELKALPGTTQAAVYYENEVEMMLIEAMPAHDALGHGVPTKLSVTGPNVVTLTVEHRKGSYVYPVVAGPSFEVGWSHVEVIEPASPAPRYEEVFEGYEEVSAPTPAIPGAAEASSIDKEEYFKKVMCSHSALFSTLGYHVLPPTATIKQYEEHCGDPWKGTQGLALAFREGLHGRFFQKDRNSPAYAEVMHSGSATESIGCVAEATSGVGVIEPQRRAHKETCVWWGKTAYGGGSSARWGEHITPVSFNVGEARAGCGDSCNGTPNPWEVIKMPPMAYYLWADGHYKFHETSCIDC
jgi:hypothetical protein